MINGKLLYSNFLRIVNGNQNDPRISTVCGEKLVSAKKGSCESRTRELYIENGIGLLLELAFDH
jgi:hypothetical protein